MLELLATMLIASILLSIAVPQLSRFGLSAARAKGATELYSALNLARSESVARNTPVVLCRRDWYTSEAYPQCATGSGTWTQGWIVFQDSDGSFSGNEPDSVDDIIGTFERVGRTTPTQDEDAFEILTTLSDATHLQFQPNGRTQQRVQFTFCENSGRLRDARLIDVALSGRVSLIPLDEDSLPDACPD